MFNLSTPCRLQYFITLLYNFGGILMKIAVISDIHANIYALINILENIDDEKVDTIICLGD